MVKPPAVHRIGLQSWVLKLTFLLIEIQYSHNSCSGWWSMMHFVPWCGARMRWCNLWCISCLRWCNAHVSDVIHTNLCNAHDDALCRGAHVMVHNGAYGHGAHVMVHMRCCTWYGAHGTMHRAWCIWHDALMMMHLTGRAFHDAHAMMHRMMLVHVHGMV